MSVLELFRKTLTLLIAGPYQITIPLMTASLCGCLYISKRHQPVTAELYIGNISAKKSVRSKVSWCLNNSWNKHIQSVVCKTK